MYAQYDFQRKQLVNSNRSKRSSLTVFNMFQRFSLRPMRSFVRCFRVAWLLLNNWYKPQVRASGRGRGDALTRCRKPPREVINQTNLLDKWPPPKKYSWQLKCREESWQCKMHQHANGVGVKVRQMFNLPWHSSAAYGFYMILWIFCWGAYLGRVYYVDM